MILNKGLTGRFRETVQVAGLGTTRRRLHSTPPTGQSGSRMRLMALVLARSMELPLRRPRVPRTGLFVSQKRHSMLVLCEGSRRVSPLLLQRHHLLLPLLPMPLPLALSPPPQAREMATSRGAALTCMVTCA